MRVVTYTIGDALVVELGEDGAASARGDEDEVFGKAGSSLVPT